MSRQLASRKVLSSSITKKSIGASIGEFPPVSPLPFFRPGREAVSLGRANLAQTRLQKSRGQSTAFLVPLVQLPAVKDPESHKSQEGNQRGQSERAEDLDD